LPISPHAAIDPLASAATMAEHHKRHVLMMLLGAASLVLAGAFIAAFVLLSGVMSTAATKQHLYVTHRILDLGLEQSVAASSEDVVAPPLDSPTQRAQGAACYHEHCASCHGAPGLPPDDAALGMMPVPTSLAHAARQHPPEWLYYVTRKGVRMTGMPAWEYRLSERSLWSTVAFVRTLPRLDPRSYLQAVKAGEQLPCERRIELPAPAEGGDVLLRQYACHSCHRIDGVVGPRVDAGPPLRQWSRRGYIAGVLPNTPQNLARWLRNPSAVSPQTLMPDLGVTPEHARIMSEFLFAQR
jgi:mono/diheme cytochrome c family protein